MIAEWWLFFSRNIGFLFLKPGTQGKIKRLDTQRHSAFAGLQQSLCQMCFGVFRFTGLQNTISTCKLNSHILFDILTRKARLLEIDHVSPCSIDMHRGQRPEAPSVPCGEPSL